MTPVVRACLFFRAVVSDRLPLLLALLLASLATVDTDGFDAAALGRSGRLGGVLPPAPRSLRPHKAHVSGGARVTITGSGFRRTASLAVRFASENAVDVVPAVFISKTTIECVTPRRDAPSTAHVSVTNGDGVEPHPLVYVRGAGAPLVFVFDDSPPGCQGCGPAGFQSSVPIPERVRERWTATESVGPDVGGTPVVVSDADGVVARTIPTIFTTARAFDGDLGFGFHRYAAPGGGFGTRGKSDRIDPTSTGNGPPVTGTFYPGDGLTCRVSCPLSYPAGLDADDAPSGPLPRFASAASPRVVYRGADANLTAPPYAETEEGDDSNPERVEPMRRAVDGVRASWIDYDVARCVRPAATDAPARARRARRERLARLSPDDIKRRTPVRRPKLARRRRRRRRRRREGGASPWVTRMGNAASVPFRYDDRVPVPTSAESSHAADALRHQLGFASRGPFAGGTEVTIRGDGFLRGDALACRFEEEGDGGRRAKRPLIPSSRRPARDSSTREPSFASRRPDIRDRGRRRTPRRWRRVSPPRYRSPTTARCGPNPQTPCATCTATCTCTRGATREPGTRVRNPRSTVSERASRLLGDVTRREAFFVARIRRTRERSQPVSSDRRHTARVGRPTPGFDRSASRRVARTPPRAGAYEGGVGAWTNVDVVRLAPGAYGGVGDVRLAVPVATSFASSSGRTRGRTRRDRRAGRTRTRDDRLSRGGIPRAVVRVVARQGGGGFGETAPVPGTDGRLVGGAVVTASRITFLGCFHADGEHEAVADGGARRTRTGRSRGRRSRREARGMSRRRSLRDRRRGEGPERVGTVRLRRRVGNDRGRWYEYEP